MRSKSQSRYQVIKYIQVLFSVTKLNKTLYFLYFRKVGSEMEANELVITKGDVITAGYIGVLATVGKIKIKVYR